MREWANKEIVEKLRTPDFSSLFIEADALRRTVHGRSVHLRALMETGNICRADCLYCGMRHSNGTLKRYSLGAETVVAIASQAVAAGFRTVVIQSGEDPEKSPESLGDVIACIRNLTGAAITLSYGEWPASAYAMWKRVGADRYLLKFETSNSGLFSYLRPGRTLEERLACLGFLKKTGYQVGTGFMVGLPGQTLEDLANDLLLLHDLDPAMAGIGPYIPHPTTPLGQLWRKGHRPAWKEDPFLRNCDPGEMTLRCLAIARIMNPYLHLPATTALGVSLRKGYARGLAAGANVLMVGVTPGAYCRRYDIYPGRRPEEGDDLSMLWRRYRDLLAREGYTVSSDRGDGYGNCRAIAC